MDAAVEATSLMSNIKFEEGANVPTVLDPYTVPLWSKGFADFLQKQSAERREGAK